MLPREVLRQIRRLHVLARRAVEDLLGGEYHSVFKGTGIAFEEVREYQPGDDIRAIDWNVTARMGHPFIKRYVEERELTVLLMVDCSGSQQFGTRMQPKREAAAELAAVLAFSAVSNNDRVGLIAFTDRVERFVPPAKGTRHVLRLIRDVLFFQPEHRGTSLREALDFLNRVQRRRAIVFLLSDFLDRGYERPLKRSGRRHDLIAVRLVDPREEELPAVGLVTVEDPETGTQLLLDTNSRRVRDAYADRARQRREALTRLMRSAQVDLVEVSTGGDHLEALLRFFRQRERRLEEDVMKRLGAAWLLGLVAALPAGAAVEYEWRPERGPAVARLRVDAVADGRPELRLSSTLLLTLTVEGLPTLEVRPPAAVTKSRGWTVRPTGPAEAGTPGRWRQQFRLDPQQPGDLPLALEPLRSRTDPAAERWDETVWPALTVRVTTTVTNANRDALRGVLPPEEVPPAPSSDPARLGWWLGGGLLVVLLAALGWAVRRRRARLVPPQAPEEWALYELRRLDALGLPEAGAGVRYHTLLSDVVRGYLEKRFGLHAPRQTTREFLEAARRSSELVPEQQTLLRDFLEGCDRAKFAGVAVSADECRAAAGRARAFLAATVPVSQAGQLSGASS